MPDAVVGLPDADKREAVDEVPVGLLALLLPVFAATAGRPPKEYPLRDIRSISSPVEVQDGHQPAI